MPRSSDGRDGAGGPRPAGTHVGVVGVGSFVAPLLRTRLERAGYVPHGVSSRGPEAGGGDAAPLSAAISLCPLWGLVDRLPSLAACGVRRLVAVSSTSRHTKASSSDPSERAIAARLAAAEEAVGHWARTHGVRVTILRPTLVYDGVHDRNVTMIAAFVRRCGWFPLVGPGSGLRQPLHADDLAAACVAACEAPAPRLCYEVSGGETLSYREMVSRIFVAVGRRPRLVQVPRRLVQVTLPALRVMPRWRGVSLAAFDRMNEPLVVDHTAATDDWGFAPRPFMPGVGVRP